MPDASEQPNEMTPAVSFSDQAAVPSDADSQEPGAATAWTVPQEPANVPLGIGMGLVFGLAAAGVYALIANMTDREFGFAALLIGYGVGFAVARFGKRKSIAMGFVAAAIAALFFGVAIMFTTAALLSAAYEVGFAEVLSEIVKAPADVMSAYFEDAMSWLFLALAAVPAFLSASGVRDNK